MNKNVYTVDRGWSIVWVDLENTPIGHNVAIWVGYISCVSYEPAIIRHVDDLSTIYKACRLYKKLFNQHKFQTIGACIWYVKENDERE